MSDLLTPVSHTTSDWCLIPRRAWQLADNGREKHGKNRYKAEWFDADGMMARHEGLRKYDDWLCAKFPDACGSAPA